MNPGDEDSIFTLAVVLSAAGAVIGSAFITGFVQLLKSVSGSFLDGRERLTAFVTSAILVVVAYVSTTAYAQPSVPVTIIGAFGAFLAWYNIARLSMANYDDAKGKTNSLRGPSD